jgi:uncharacterized membrane protein
MDDQQLARGLGWFSIGLGLAELLAPRKVGDAIGVNGHDELIRAYGVREMISGVGILMNERPQPGWLWSRVAGDVVDLGSLAAAMRSGDSDRQRNNMAMAMVLGVTVLDVLCASRLQQSSRRNELYTDGNQPLTRLGSSRRGRHTRKVITIDRPAAEIYSFWRNFENLPQFMNHLESVSVQPDGRSHWVAKGPAGTKGSWDAEVTADTPNELIGWRSLPGSMVENAGTVRFEPATGGRGTVVRVDLQYRMPGGAVGAAVAKLFGESPEKQIPVDLMRLKQLLETGEIARTEGQSAGREHSTSRKYDDFIRT